MDELLSVAAALSDRNRVRALMALRNGELCVCQITALLRLAPSTVSNHMSILRSAGLVLGRKRGRWMHYRRCPGTAPASIRKAYSLLDSTLARDAAVRRDARDLERILKTPREELCRTS